MIIQHWKVQRGPFLLQFLSTDNRKINNCNSKFKFKNNFLLQHFFATPNETSFRLRCNYWNDQTRIGAYSASLIHRRVTGWRCVIIYLIRWSCWSSKMTIPKSQCLGAYTFILMIDKTARVTAFLHRIKGNAFRRGGSVVYSIDFSCRLSLFQQTKSTRLFLTILFSYLRFSMCM